MKEAVLRTRRAVAPALLAMFALAACDRLGEIVILPEGEIVDSFEAGIASWTVRTGDLGSPAGSGDAQGTSTAASDGVRSLALHLANTGGSGKLWVSRKVDLTPDQDYDVEITFEVGTTQSAGSVTWTVIAGAHAAEPGATAGLTFRDATPVASATSGSVTWVEKSYQLVVRTTAAGEGVVTLGLWGTTAEERTYYLDNVRVTFTRR